jgi:hypothetical protein
VLNNPEARKYYFGEGMELGINPVRPPHQPPVVKETYTTAVEEPKRKLRGK